ncbi:MAG TPA: SUMF1/EgtB/PvdO family nonheme iron enzyme [Gemmataceae bacterium]|nr:SUMF1/EgtB/PvdO family nonheme iron enzyme [Gemmataceae bacterium]
MPETVTHPTPEVLSAFGLGKLPEAAAATVARHLDTCPACRQAVEKLPGDYFLGKVQAAKPDRTALPQPPATARQAAARSALEGVPPPVGPPAGLPQELANHPRYSILRELGRGGMGVVYEARQTVMNRQVVIKVINKSLLDNPDAVERFRREVEAAARLAHPNIVTAYDAEQAGELHMLVMEFVPGENMAEVLHKKGPLPVAYACHFVRQAALGLQHAFEQGMVHRDIKPQNLMLTPKGQVKVLDFGLARLRGAGLQAGGLTQTGAFMGTPEYVSPEQATDARAADIRADLYSLGCTLYFLLTGRPPFTADTAVKLVLAHIEKEPTPLRELRPDVPEGLSAVVGRLLAKDPGQRYQTPVELAQALVPFIKAGAKGAPVSMVSRPQGVASPDKGTIIGAETSRMGRLERGGGVRAPAAQAAAPGDAGDPFTSMVAPPDPRQKLTTSARVKAGRWARQWWLIGTAVAVVLVALVGLWASGVFRLRTPEGILVVTVNEPTPDVYVDGDKMTVTWGKDGKAAVIGLKPGTHKVQVKKDGFSAFGEEVELEDGQRRVLTARLVSPAPAAAVKLSRPARAEAPFDPENAKELQQAWARYLGTNVEEDVDLGQGVKLTLVLIPPGQFQMGSPDNEEGHQKDEQKHPVEITEPFYLGKYTVTVGQFRRFVNDAEYKTEAEQAGEEHNWRAVGSFEQTDEHPVVDVTWNDARAFCEWLGKETGKKYRVPTEAEWEYSCRAGTTTPFYSGDSVDKLSEVARVNKAVTDGTAPVGQYKPNGFGLYDMHGNVWQWCQDWYDRDYYIVVIPNDSPRQDPPGPAAGSFRVNRGGAFPDVSWDCRAAKRDWDAPANRNDLIGFRVVCVR